MIKDYPWGAAPEYQPKEKYYALAERFDPRAYDPDRWLAAARSAGFTYAVLTAKHHDGYCLWPSAYGDWNTGRFLGGRDLIAPFVEACRRHGMRVGLYFSPRDWSYPGFPIEDVDFDHKKNGQFAPVDPEVNRAEFERFYRYTRGQMEELLTRYGRIDLLWFDGVCWPGVGDPRTVETIEWVRSLQPGIVVNDRWNGAGDFATPECHLPAGRPEGWWEACAIWNGHWGYSPRQPLKPTPWVLETLLECRTWGGNFLLNSGPSPDGEMLPQFYARCEELAGWMRRSPRAPTAGGRGTCT
jgi:alpha-L-fucosidase